MEDAEGSKIVKKAPTSEIDQRRASALLLFFMQLDSTDRAAFGSIMNFKSRVSVCGHYLLLIIDE